MVIVSFCIIDILTNEACWSWVTKRLALSVEWGIFSDTCNLTVYLTYSRKFPVCPLFGRSGKFIPIKSLTFRKNWGMIWSAILTLIHMDVVVRCILYQKAVNKVRNFPISGTQVGFSVEWNPQFVSSPPHKFFTFSSSLVYPQ